MADIASYMNFWFLRRNLEPIVEELTQGMVFVRRWRARIIDLGHDRAQPLTSQEALDIARSASPGPFPAHDPADPLNLEPGAAVVTADDYGRDPVAGTLVSATADQITLARDHERVGRVHVHFPRTEYIAVKG